jgi:hypothetical protein
VLGQPPLERGRVLQAAPMDPAGEPNQLRVGEPVAGEVRDRDVLEQVGDHVLHEPGIGPVVGRWLGGLGRRAAAGEGRDNDPEPEPPSHPG